VRFKPGKPGIFNVYAIYCRNDMTMSETTAWTPANGPTDPRIGELFRELFMVVFSDFAVPAPQPGRRHGPRLEVPGAPSAPQGTSANQTAMAVWYSLLDLALSVSTRRPPMASPFVR
jgi:hypothetical protein